MSFQETSQDNHEGSRRIRDFLGELAVTAALQAAAYGVIEGSNDVLNSGLPNYLAFPMAVAIGTAVSTSTRHP